MTQEIPVVANLKVATHVFFLRNNGTEILVLKRKGTGFADGMWSVPAGRLDEGESLTAAALREAEEEVGLRVSQDDLSNPLIMHFRDARGERIFAFFVAKQWEGEPENREPEKCECIEWRSMDDLGPQFLSHVELALTKILQGQTYCEVGF